MIDHYATLGVSRNATSIEIRDAYLKLARDTHPDKVRGREERKKAEDVFKNVTAAYDTLSKDRSRRDYTARLPTVSETNAGTPTAGASSAPPGVSGRPLTHQDQKSGPAPVQPAAGSRKNEAIPTTGRINFDALGEGIAAYKKQDYHTAVQLLNMAVTRDQGNAKAHAMLGLALAKNPNWLRDALQHMELASKLEPKNVSYLAELALLLQSQGLKLRARRTIETAMALNPQHPDVARALKEIPIEEPAAPTRTTAETARGLFDRLRKR